MAGKTTKRVRRIQRKNIGLPELFPWKNETWGRNNVDIKQAKKKRNGENGILVPDNVIYSQDRYLFRKNLRGSTEACCQIVVLSYKGRIVANQAFLV